MSKKLGLVLGAGGARGISHIGFLQALEENGIKPDIITGCSIGAVIGSIYLSGYTPQRMIHIAKTLKKSDFYDFSLLLYTNRALLKSKKLDKLFSRFLKDKTFADLPIPFACTATDLKSGQNIVFSKGPLRDAVRASATIPGGFTPIEKDGMLLVDGGLTNKLPVKVAKDLGADITIAVDVLEDLPAYTELKNILQLAYRSIEIIRGLNKNTWAKENLADLVISPKLGNVSEYKVEKQQFCYDAGYKAGIESIDKIKKLLN